MGWENAGPIDAMTPEGWDAVCSQLRVLTDQSSPLPDGSSTAVVGKMKLDLLRSLEGAKPEDIQASDLVHIRLVLMSEVVNSRIKFIDMQSKRMDGHGECFGRLLPGVSRFHDFLKRFSVLSRRN